MRPATAPDTDCMLVLARFNSNVVSFKGAHDIGTLDPVAKVDAERPRCTNTYPKTPCAHNIGGYSGLKGSLYGYFTA